jgi:HEAT repeat protein
MKWFLVSSLLFGITQSLLGQDNTANPKRSEPVLWGRTVRQWIPVLKDAKSEARCNAAVALGEFGPNAKEAVIPLAEALKDKDERVRLLAATALGKVGPSASLATPALSDLVGKKESSLCRAAITALGRIGPNAKEAVPALKKALKEEDKALL